MPAINAHFFQRAILTHKVGKSDLVFGVLSGFVSSLVKPIIVGLCARKIRLQVSVCSGYDFSTHPGHSG